VTRRARTGFDVERITRRFYDQFQKEHSAFLKFISGIPESGDREWYASVMLNRLMFVYFMQRKGFLDGTAIICGTGSFAAARRAARTSFTRFTAISCCASFMKGWAGENEAPTSKG
jgi:hypothetical protein